MIQLDFNTIINNFDSDIWQFSYLTAAEIEETLNFPVKMGDNIIHRVSQYQIDLDNYYLVVLKYSPNFDYSLNPDFMEHFHRIFPHIRIEPFCCNYKYAGMLAGMGQIARNSLLHNSRFDFDFHVGVFTIGAELINLPSRTPANPTMLATCEGCSDCINACPVQAIRNRGQFSWVDVTACDNFAHFGNHEHIPSIKWGWYNSNFDMHARMLSVEEVEKMTSFKDFVERGLHINTVNYENGQAFAVSYPVCKECTCQPRCTKYNGQYPYELQKPQKIYL